MVVVVRSEAFHNRVLSLPFEKGFTSVLMEEQTHVFFGKLTENEIKDRLPEFSRDKGHKFDVDGRAVNVKGGGAFFSRGSYETLQSIELDPVGIVRKDLRKHDRTLSPQNAHFLTVALTDLLNAKPGESISATIEGIEYILIQKSPGNIDILRFTNFTGLDWPSLQGLPLGRRYQPSFDTPPGGKFLNEKGLQNQELKRQKQLWKNAEGIGPGDINLKNGIIPLEKLPGERTLSQMWRLQKSDSNRLTPLNYIPLHREVIQNVTYLDDVIKSLYPDFTKNRGRSLRASFLSGLSHPGESYFVENDRSVDGKWHDPEDLVPFDPNPKMARKQHIMTIRKELTGLLIIYLRDKNKRNLHEFFEGFFPQAPSDFEAVFNDFVSQIDASNGTEPVLRTILGIFSEAVYDMYSDQSRSLEIDVISVGGETSRFDKKASLYLALMVFLTRILKVTPETIRKLSPLLFVVVLASVGLEYFGMRYLLGGTFDAATQWIYIGGALYIHAALRFLLRNQTRGSPVKNLVRGTLTDLGVVFVYLLFLQILPATSISVFIPLAVHLGVDVFLSQKQETPSKSQSPALPDAPEREPVPDANRDSSPPASEKTETFSSPLDKVFEEAEKRDFANLTDYLDRLENHPDELDRMFPFEVYSYEFREITEGESQKALVIQTDAEKKGHL